MQFHNRCGTHHNNAHSTLRNLDFYAGHPIALGDGGAYYDANGSSPPSLLEASVYREEAYYRRFSNIFKKGPRKCVECVFVVCMAILAVLQYRLAKSAWK